MFASTGASIASTTEMIYGGSKHCGGLEFAIDKRVFYFFYFQPVCFSISKIHKNDGKFYIFLHFDEKYVIL